jgi:hypothetical protein
MAIMLFHFIMDLAALHQQTSGNHIVTHQNPSAIITKVCNLFDPKLLSDLNAS